MAKGAYSMAEGKPSGSKFFCSGKDKKNPRVLVAESDRAALSLWAGITGRKEDDGVARPIGTQAKTITREVKPQAATPEKEIKKDKPDK